MLVDSHCAYQKHRTPRRFIGPVLRLTTCLTGPSSWDGRQRFYRPLYQTAGEPRDFFWAPGNRDRTEKWTTTQAGKLASGTTCGFDNRRKEPLSSDAVRRRRRRRSEALLGPGTDEFQGQSGGQSRHLDALAPRRSSRRASSACPRRLLVPKAFLLAPFALSGRPDAACRKRDTRNFDQPAQVSPGLRKR